MQELPLTFQHAIAITRKLGYQYLWIDSLCIIQDSKEDWDVESLDMKRVYQMSALTIGAARGADSHAGCFVTRQPLDHFPCRIAQLSTGFWKTPFDREMPGKSLPHAFTGAPLFDRCWVLQERMLSPRTLYYGPKGLHWECTECYSNEIYRQGRSSASLKTDTGDLEPLSGLGIHIYASDHRLKLDMSKLGPSTTLIDVFEETTYIRHFYEVWNKLLVPYTKMKLSFPSDILRALSGLISSIEQSTGLTSVSGHWKEFLPFDLLWRNASPDHCSKAPVYASWSWASMRDMRWGIECPLVDEDMLLRPFRLLSRFISYDIPPTEDRTPSSVRETGTLVLRGPLLKDILIPNDPNHPSLESDPGPPFQQRLLSGSLPKDYLWPDIVLEDSMEIHCLIVLNYVSKPSPLFPLGFQTYAGLLLRHKSDDGDTFERIGYLEKWYYMNQPDELASSLKDAVRTIRLV